MTLSEVIAGIGTGELKVKEIAQALDKSDRTVSKRIKSFGYKWNSKGVKYEPVLDSYNPDNDSKIFVELFDQSPIKRAVKASQEVKKAKDEVASTKEKPSQKQAKQSYDTIDSILFGKSEARVQRAYYIDADLAEIIDKVEGKQKSNLVNECIRKVFQDKGIL